MQTSSIPQQHSYFSIEGVYWLIGVISATFCAYLITDHTFNFFGGDDAFSLAYNYYYLSLLEGRQDIPMKTIGWEGLYLKDGTAYMYYGIAPAFLRALFDPFVDLTITPVARAVVWGLAITSGFISQLTLLNCVRYSSIRHQGLLRATLWLGGIALWLTSPILILSAGASIYHEPIAMAHLCTMISIHFCFRIAHGSPHKVRYLYLLALFAGIALHSRPHVGIGLYTATCLLLFWTIYSDQHFLKEKLLIRKTLYFIAREHTYSIYVFLILFFFGIIYIVTAQPKISILTTLGIDPAVYGFLFFDFESIDSVRQVGFQVDGRFNLLRIIPNLEYYTLGALPLFESLKILFDLNFIRREGPTDPILLIWQPWLLLSIIGSLRYLFLGIKVSSFRGFFAPFPVILFLSTLIMAMFILSYGTITHRYKVELWPLIWIISILSIPCCLNYVERHLSAFKKYLIIFITIIGTTSILSISVANRYSLIFNNLPLWNYETCISNLQKAQVETPLPLALCN